MGLGRRLSGINQILAEDVKVCLTNIFYQKKISSSAASLTPNSNNEIVNQVKRVSFFQGVWVLTVSLLAFV